MWQDPRKHYVASSSLQICPPDGIKLSVFFPYISLRNVYRVGFFVNLLFLLCIAAVCIVVIAFTFDVNKSGLSGTFTPLFCLYTAELDAFLVFQAC